MGGGASKAKKDNYVLRLAPEGGDSNAPTKASKPPLESQKSMRKRSMDSGSTSPVGSSGKQKSSRILISPDGPAPSLGALRGSSMRGSVKSLNGSCSEYYPWLLKNTKLTGALLGNFEFGPVIGKKV